MDLTAQIKKTLQTRQRQSNTSQTAGEGERMRDVLGCCHANHNSRGSSCFFVCLFAVQCSAMVRGETQCTALYTTLCIHYTHHNVVTQEVRKIKQTFYLKFVTFFPGRIMNVGHTNLLQTLNGDVWEIASSDQRPCGGFKIKTFPPETSGLPSSSDPGVLTPANVILAGEDSRCNFLLVPYKESKIVDISCAHYDLISL